MGILNSVLVGKARNSAGNITTYNRLGVSCFRQKPSLSPGYVPSAAQRQQRRVYQYVKTVINNYALAPTINFLTDAARKSGKGQTKMNMFYQSFLPHIQEHRLDVSALPDASLTEADLFLGTIGDSIDAFARGSLGSLALDPSTAGAISVSSTAMQSVLDKANSMRSTSQSEFTLADVYINYVYSDGVAVRSALSVRQTNSSAGGVITFTPASAPDLSSPLYCYVSLTIGSTDATNQLNTTVKYFNTSTIAASTI